MKVFSVSFACDFPDREKLAKLFPRNRHKDDESIDIDREFSREGRFWWDASYLLDMRLKAMGLTFRHAYGFSDGSMFKHVLTEKKKEGLKADIEKCLLENSVLGVHWYVDDIREVEDSLLEAEK